MVSFWYAVVFFFSFSNICSDGEVGGAHIQIYVTVGRFGGYLWWVF